MSYLEMLRAGNQADSLPEVGNPHAPCQSCRDLQAQGIRVLLCGTCGSRSSTPSRQISTEDREAFRRQVEAGRGRSANHRWLGREVNSPRGQGRLIWTDGFRAAIAIEPNSCWFVDLAEVNTESE